MQQHSSVNASLFLSSDRSSANLNQRTNGSHSATGRGSAQLNVITSSSVSSASKFDAIRNCAVSMFKQQAKDLTNVSQLTSTVDAMEQARAKLVQRLSCLRKLVALDESKVQMLQQRVARKEHSLRELTAAVSILEDEKQAYAGVPESLSSNIFRVLDETCSTYSVSGELLKPILRSVDSADEERFPSSDALERDIAAHRMRCSLLDSLYQQLIEGGSVPAALGPLIHQWSAEVEYSTAPLFARDFTADGSRHVSLNQPALTPDDKISSDTCGSYIQWFALVERRHRDASVAAGKLGLEGPLSVKEPLETLRQLLAQCSSATDRASALDQEVAGVSEEVVNWQRRLSQALRERLSQELELSHLMSNLEEHATLPCTDQHVALKQWWLHELQEHAAAQENTAQLQAELDALFAQHTSLDHADADRQLELEDITRIEETVVAPKVAQALEIDAQCDDQLRKNCAQLDQIETLTAFTSSAFKMLAELPFSNHSAEYEWMQQLSKGLHSLLERGSEIRSSLGECNMWNEDAPPPTPVDNDPLIALLSQKMAVVVAEAFSANEQRMACEESIAAVTPFINGASGSELLCVSAPMNGGVTHVRNS
jgi:hypothetical protein